MTWVEGAVTWQWWIGTLLTMGIGAIVGWVARGMVDRELDDGAGLGEWEDAQRAARVYQREIERAKRRHPSHG